MRGTVVAFDDPRGLGVVALDHPGEDQGADVTTASYPFHCTALTDGSRTVEVGQAVTFDVRPGGMGRWEATRITSLAPVEPLAG